MCAHMDNPPENCPPKSVARKFSFKENREKIKALFQVVLENNDPVPVKFVTDVTDKDVDRMRQRGINMAKQRNQQNNQNQNNQNPPDPADPADPAKKPITFDDIMNTFKDNLKKIFTGK